MSVRLIPGDCLVELPKLAVAGERFHCCVTDPPYGLEFMGREWDGADGFRRSLNEADAGRDSVFGRTSRHAPEFRAPPVFQQWCEAWARAVYDVLLPGAFLLAFGGTRTSHRLGCAIEDAGFEIRDTVAWIYGSGFPKSLDVSKSIDKMRGAEREVIEQVRVRGGGTEHINRSNNAVHDYRPGAYQKGENVLDVTAPATPEAAQWQGWGTALKPAMELICVARKPLIGTVVQNVLAHRTGALNIDGCRVGTGGATKRSGQAAYPKNPDGTEDRSQHWARTGHSVEMLDAGRWPANIVHDGSEEVLAAFPDRDGAVSNGKRGVRGVAHEGYGPMDQSPSFGDSGSAARFFYSAKADRADRADSKHPTVKPVDLMRWLVTLVCPPGGRLLDPFAGSGTTGEACMLAGFDCTLIERDPQHVADIRHRIKRWSGLDQPLFAEPAA